MRAFWETWAAAIASRIGSCGVELFGGLLLATAVEFIVDGLITRALAATCASLIYESFLDPNGFNLVDVLQRSLGIALGLGLWAWLR